jgi:hypothetical protein
MKTTSRCRCVAPDAPDRKLGVRRSYGKAVDVRLRDAGPEFEADARVERAEQQRQEGSVRGDSNATVGMSLEHGLASGSHTGSRFAIRLAALMREVRIVPRGAHGGSKVLHLAGGQLSLSQIGHLHDRQAQSCGERLDGLARPHVRARIDRAQPLSIESISDRLRIAMTTRRQRPHLVGRPHRVSVSHEKQLRHPRSFRAASSPSTSSA